MSGVWTAHKYMVNAKQMKLTKKMEVVVSRIEKKFHGKCSLKYVQYGGYEEKGCSGRLFSGNVVTELNLDTHWEEVATNSKGSVPPRKDLLLLQHRAWGLGKETQSWKEERRHLPEQGSSVRTWGRGMGSLTSYSKVLCLPGLRLGRHAETEPDRHIDCLGDC